jgi:IMP dehydrogenase
MWRKNEATLAARAAVSGAMCKVSRKIADEVVRRIGDMMYPGMDGNGITREDVFRLNPGVGLTFADITVVPRPVEKVPTEVDLTMPFGPYLRPSCCITSSPMDRVTEAGLCISMARNGGIGIEHINMTIDRMRRDIGRVKDYEPWLITSPHCMTMDSTVKDVRRIKRAYDFSTVLVTSSGHPDSTFEGIVFRKSYESKDGSLKLKEIMIKKDDPSLIVAEKSDVRRREDAEQIFLQHPKVSKLVILNSDKSVFALVTKTDLEKSDPYPNALKDDAGRLVVGAAVTTHKKSYERAEVAIQAGADVIVIDASMGSTPFMVQRIKEIKEIAKKAGKQVTIVAGNIVTTAQALMLMEAGAHVLRGGMSPGSICTTHGTILTGSPQVNTIYHVSKLGLTTIGDGGNGQSGDALAALVFGAANIMLGKLLCATSLSCSPLIEEDGKLYKLYRGMGSKGAQAERDDGSRYHNERGEIVIAQGVEDTKIDFTGPTDKFLQEFQEAIKLGLKTWGCASIAEAHAKVKEGTIRFLVLSGAGKRELGVHV